VDAKSVDGLSSFGAFNCDDRIPETVLKAMACGQAPESQQPKRKLSLLANCGPLYQPVLSGPDSSGMCGKLRRVRVSDIKPISCRRP